MCVTEVRAIYYEPASGVSFVSFSSSAMRSDRSSLRNMTAPGFSDCFKRCTVLRRDAIRSSVEGVVGLCDGITCHGLSARTSVRPMQRCGPGWYMRRGISSRGARACLCPSASRSMRSKVARRVASKSHLGWMLKCNWLHDDANTNFSS